MSALLAAQHRASSPCLNAKVVHCVHLLFGLEARCLGALLAGNCMSVQCFLVGLAQQSVCLKCVCSTAFCADCRSGSRFVLRYFSTKSVLKVPVTLGPVCVGMLTNPTCSRCKQRSGMTLWQTRLKQIAVAKLCVLRLTRSIDPGSQKLLGVEKSAVDVQHCLGRPVAFANNPAMHAVGSAGGMYSDGMHGKGVPATETVTGLVTK